MGVLARNREFNIKMGNASTAWLHPHLTQGTQFSVILTEGRPDETGITTARAISDLHVPTSVILDSGVGYCMDRWEGRWGGIWWGWQ